MYKKAFLVIVVGVAVFYALAMLKMFFFHHAATQPQLIGVVTPPPTPPTPVLIPTPEVPVTGDIHPRIDVVFTIDSTGSMGDEIDVVKSNIRNIISEISQGQPAPDVRYGIVTYRDRGDEYVTKSWQLTRDVPSIQRALSSIVAAGGGDKPESVNEALHVTLHNLAWDEQAKSKIVFLIGDAGPHYYPNDFRWEDEVKFASGHNITINSIACSGIEPDEERVFNAISTSTNGMYAHLTYKQEYAKADGTRATVIEEAGRTYEISKAADKDWARGADELVARNEAKETSMPGGVTGDLPYASPAAPRDAESYAEGGVESGVVGGVATGAPRGVTMSLPTAPSPAESMARADMAMKAKPAAPMNAVGEKTNNLNTVLADSIKKAAIRQGTTYGTAISPAFDFKGTNCDVKAAKQLIIDNKAQLQSLLGAASGIDINRIDFNNQIVVAAFLGQAASDATITISNVSINGNELYVMVKQQNGKSASATAAPFHLIVLPRQQGGVRLDAKNTFVRFTVN